MAGVIEPTATVSIDDVLCIAIAASSRRIPPSLAARRLDKPWERDASTWTHSIGSRCVNDPAWRLLGHCINSSLPSRIPCSILPCDSMRAPMRQLLGLVHIGPPHPSPGMKCDLPPRLAALQARLNATRSGHPPLQHTIVTLFAWVSASTVPSALPTLSRVLKFTMGSALLLAHLLGPALSTRERLPLCLPSSLPEVVSLPSTLGLELRFATRLSISLAYLYLPGHFTAGW